MSPHLVSIGPITAAPAQALPQDLEAFVQSAGEHGTVYASLGTTAIPGERARSRYIMHVYQFQVHGCGSALQLLGLLVNFFTQCMIHA